VSQPAHLAVQIRGQVGIVEQHDIRFTTPCPRIGVVPQDAADRIHFLTRAGIIADPPQQPVPHRLARLSRFWRRVPGELPLPGPVDVLTLVIQ
jgi:hypothetical protein